MTLKGLITALDLNDRAEVRQAKVMKRLGKNEQMKMLMTTAHTFNLLALMTPNVEVFAATPGLLTVKWLTLHLSGNAGGVS